MSFTLITTIVSHGKGDKIMDAAVKAGSSGGTVLHGRGISPNAIAAALGIESTKDIVFILAENESKSSIYDAILDATKKERAHLGCMFTSPAGQLIKNGTVTGEEMLMPENNSQD